MAAVKEGLGKWKRSHYAAVEVGSLGGWSWQIEKGVWDGEGEAISQQGN